MQNVLQYGGHFYENSDRLYLHPPRQHKKTGRSHSVRLRKRGSLDLKETTPDLSGYDCIGLASGIYGFQLSPELITFVKTHLPENKYIFCLYTYGGINKKSYTKSLKEAVSAVGGKYLGEYCCTGFNTFGPFKLMGGSAKGHPNDKDLAGAVSFAKKILTVLEKY